jgi:hypothetical protein
MMRASPLRMIYMNQHPETEADPQVVDKDVEGLSLLVEAQGREMQQRRDREAHDASMSHKPRSTKTPRPSRFRRLFGG